MAHTSSTSREARSFRHRRIRKTVSGTTERPRLCVFRSLNHIYAQVIDDSRGVTLVSASSVEPSVKTDIAGKPKRDVAKTIGQLVGQRASEAGIRMVVFDRAGFRYHGRVQALADGARERGLQF